MPGAASVSVRLKAADVPTGISSGKPADERHFDFGKVFAGAPTPADGNAQADVWSEVRQLVLSCVDGTNACVFAYGQTGSGKTYTMLGNGGHGVKDAAAAAADGAAAPSPSEHAGIAPRAASEVFTVLDERDALCSCEVVATMLELYCDGLRDLLAPPSKDPSGRGEHLTVKLAQHTKSGLVEVDGATRVVVKDAAALNALIATATAARATSGTNMNAQSSRSHLVVALELRSTNRRTSAVTCGKLTLVDLAGSERVDRSGSAGDRLKEAQSINKSLSALGDVVGAVSTGAKHVPYRNHPLTMLMSDSIGGAARTLIADGEAGTAFEVTADGEVVWARTLRCAGDYDYSVTPPLADCLFRAARYEADYEGLVGDLSAPLECGPSEFEAESVALA